MARLLRNVREQCADGYRELAMAIPDRRLCPDVQRYAGYIEEGAPPQLWRELPHGGVVLVLSFGEPFAVGRGDEPAQIMPSFVAGLHDRWAMVASLGAARCLQVDLTPLGAVRLFARPMDDLTNRVLPLEALIGRDGHLLAERLATLPDWSQRFALVEELLLRRFAENHAPSADIAWAWGQLNESGGALPVGSLAREIGCSRKHLVTRFRREVGLPPKLMARILRFDRMMRQIERRPPTSWAEAALDFGYYDQAHLSREFRALVGLSPTEWLCGGTADVLLHDG